mmetsp:Transcript_55316/g.113133  ORF Transcript_55316/g.113133 Transcript_55316/m.113133 type:complete len:155 (+) Transcript_55316:23-487(+)
MYTIAVPYRYIEDASPVPISSVDYEKAADEAFPGAKKRRVEAPSTTTASLTTATPSAPSLTASITPNKNFASANASELPLACEEYGLEVAHFEASLCTMKDRLNKEVIPQLRDTPAGTVLHIALEKEKATLDSKIASITQRLEEKHRDTGAYAE